MWVLERLVTHDFHVLCVGPTGTGKTLSVADKLMRGMPDKYSPVFVGFSAQTWAGCGPEPCHRTVPPNRASEPCLRTVPP
eukprot:210995-Prymnesium_polylepis.1